MLVQVGPVDEDYDLKNNPSLQFVNEVKGGNIPKEFIPSIQKGFEAAMKNGILGGYPLDSLKVTVVDGGFHPLDSDQLSFEIAAQMAFEEACSKADPVLLEPIMKINVETSEESMDTIINDLNKRRGEVEAMYEVRSGIRLIKAQVPLSEIHGYDISLQAITSGHTSWSVEYDHYAPLPDSIAKMVLGIKSNPTSIQDEYYYSEEDIKEIMGFAPSKLRAAKWYQEKYNCSLKDAKDVVDKVWEKQRQELTLNGKEQVEGKGCIITILIAITSTFSMFCLI